MQRHLTYADDTERWHLRMKHRLAAIDEGRDPDIWDRINKVEVRLQYPDGRLTQKFCTILFLDGADIEPTIVEAEKALQTSLNE